MSIVSDAVFAALFPVNVCIVRVVKLTQYLPEEREYDDRDDQCGKSREKERCGHVAVCAEGREVCLVNDSRQEQSEKTASGEAQEGTPYVARVLSHAAEPYTRNEQARQIRKATADWKENIQLPSAMAKKIPNCILAINGSGYVSPVYPWIPEDYPGDNPDYYYTPLGSLTITDTGSVIPFSCLAFCTSGCVSTARSSRAIAFSRFDSYVICTSRKAVLSE